MAVATLRLAVDQVNPEGAPHWRGAQRFIRTVKRSWTRIVIELPDRVGQGIGGASRL